MAANIENTSALDALENGRLCILQLLTVCKNQSCLKIPRLSWESPDTTTAGMMRIALSRIIPRFPIGRGWDRYHQKYEFDFNELIDQLRPDKAEAA
ncbi:hypothetical protein [Endozoicomonas acroporae]|uniref:hypothetical protein n=1 Tax=Endozoicomonas acroporae TaxID=1701104 RepID=UPI003D7B5878